jgi:hypothetical protein
MEKRSGIYVEILIHGDIEEVWKHTQVPELHERWDLRFTTIKYLPRSSETEPQRFLYATRIGMGLAISGEGESTGNREDAGGWRTSALKFWSADWRSLIEEGAGYWQYSPNESSNTRFLTWYDYRTRFGLLGRFVDRILFRPLLGWATAWSFDRLRLWIEKGTQPESSLRLSMIHACSRIAIASIWFWQGLVPKLLFDHADERAMIAAAHLSTRLVPVVGVIELVIAFCTILFWRSRSVFVFNILAMAIALASVAAMSPSYLFAAFNPVTLNFAIIALSVIGYFASADIPSASRCLRKAPEDLL